MTPPPLANVKHKVKSLTCIDISPSWDTHHGSRRRRKNIKQQEREREKCLILETESALPSFSRSSTRFQHPSTNDVPTTFKRASGNKMNDKLSSFIQGNYQELSNHPRHLFFSSKNIKKKGRKRENVIPLGNSNGGAFGSERKSLSSPSAGRRDTHDPVPHRRALPPLLPSIEWASGRAD